MLCTDLAAINLYSFLEKTLLPLLGMFSVSVFVSVFICLFVSQTYDVIFLLIYVLKKKKKKRLGKQVVF